MPSENIHKSHNVTMLLYHLIFPIKYRKNIVDEKISFVIEDVSQKIEFDYEISFLEIGTDGDHVHFLVQSVPTYSVTKIVTMIKSIVSKGIFSKFPELRNELSGKFWSSGFFVNTVGNGSNEEIISKYVHNQGKIYEQFTTKKT